jgi:hypothetical protein
MDTNNRSRSKTAENLLLEVLQESDELTGTTAKGMTPSPRQDVGH